MYQIISEDITLFDGDAILNSLGAGPNAIIDAPGAVFRSILSKVGNNAPKLRKEVYEKGANLKFNQAFITDSYGLQCKYIVNVISPYARDDDKELTKLKEAYTNSLKLAYENGIRSICLPLIGTGANGYNLEQSFKAAKSSAYKFFEEHEDFDVYVTAFWQDEEMRDELGSYPRRRPRFNGSDLRITLNDACRSMPMGPIDSRHINMYDLPLEMGDSFGRLIDLFIIAREGDDDKKTLNEGWNQINSDILGAKDDMDDEEPKRYIPIEEEGKQTTNYKNHWHKHPNYKKTHLDKQKGIVAEKTQKKSEWGEEDPNGIWDRPTKIMILLVACSLNMTRTQAYFLYKFCGYYLSRYDEEDAIITELFEYLATEEEDAAIFTACNLYQMKTGKQIFTKHKPKVKKEN